MKNSLLLTAIFVFVLFANSAILASGWIYAEQPMLYAANQMIHSFSDFLGIYWHPRMLEIFSIPFFRPSGHFFMYQVLMPFLGWHNTQGLLLVNFFFLALSGFLFVKCYALLFPGYRIGAYLALGLYLMHPALLLPRMIVLHFEFAQVFFCLLSFYCFQKDHLFKALLFYAVAVTFKESALMLGPVLAVYFCVSRYTGGSLFHFFRQKEIRQVLLLLTIVTLSLALYLSLAWPSLSHPLSTAITFQGKTAAAWVLLSHLFGLPVSEAQLALLQQSHLLWRELIFTPLTHLFLGIFFGASLLVGCSLLFARMKMERENRKSFVFLLIAGGLFLVLPINWAMGLPWHLNLSLVFFSWMAGFSVEYGLLRLFQNQNKVFVSGLLLVILLGFNARNVNQVNLEKMAARADLSFKVTQNAILHPPAIEEKLNSATVVLVEDSLLHEAYALGNSQYPLFLKPGLDYEALEKTQAYSFLKYQPIYNGYLFKWAYLRPDLQEEVYPFEIGHLEKVPDAVIHRWLQEADNLVCLGYDREGHWSDRSEELKRHLQREKQRRFLRVHSYTPFAASILSGQLRYTQTLSLPDYRLCQYACDQDKFCKGFTYENAHFASHSAVKCQFYESLALQKTRFCASCIGFVKG